MAGAVVEQRRGAVRADIVEGLEPAIAAAKKGQVKFFPTRWKKVYLHWMTNIHDWCISRQLWWGHRIPVWYCQDPGCKAMTVSVDSS